MLLKLEKIKINDIQLNVQLYQTKIEQKKYDLYIKNIPLNYEKKDLIKIFNKYGPILNITLNKGFGYISFDNEESAEKAKDDLNGKYLPGYESWFHPLSIEFLKPNQEQQNINMNNNDFSTLNYFCYNDKEIMNDNNINININDNYSNKNIRNNNKNLYSAPTIFNFNNINININQYNNSNIDFNHFNNLNNPNFNINNSNNQFNIYNQLPFPNIPNITYNQFMNYNNYYLRGKNHSIKRNKHNRNNNYNNITYNEDDINWNEYNNLKTEEEKREFIGEIIFRKIENSDIIKENNISEKIIGKITGMILGLPSKKEIFEIMEDNNTLYSRIEEALELIRLNANNGNTINKDMNNMNNMNNE